MEHSGEKAGREERPGGSAERQTVTGQPQDSQSGSSKPRAGSQLNRQERDAEDRQMPRSPRSPQRSEENRTGMTRAKSPSQLLQLPAEQREQLAGDTVDHQDTSSSTPYSHHPGMYNLKIFYSKEINGVG